MAFKERWLHKLPSSLFLGSIEVHAVVTKIKIVLTRGKNMIGGIVMILTVIWVYQSLMRAKKSNVLMWVSISAIVFLVIQILFYNINIMIVDGLEGKDVGGEYDRDLTSVGDRKTTEGAGGWFMPVVFELLPPIAGFLSVAVIRTMFIMKEALTPANLFSGVKEMFNSIKDSFKTSSN